MRRRAALLLGLAALLVAAVGLLLAGGLPGPPTAERANRPGLLLLTSLPLVFGEEFSLDGGGSPTAVALERRFRLVPISVTTDAELGRGRLLLMAQPPAQRAEDLVALDRWVRRGGRLLLLADPMLEWPSELPLGSPLRPPAMFMDTGLLRHWGLRLNLPEQRGLATRRLAGAAVRTLSAGSLQGKCRVSGDRFVASCKLGRGMAVVVADADFLAADRLDNGAGNLDALVAALAELDSADL